MVAVARREPLSPITVNGRDLDIEDLAMVARDGAPIVLSDEARSAVEGSFAALLGCLERGDAVYGLTTGVGALDRVVVDPHDPRRQRNLLLSHAAGVGEPMSAEEVRAMMLARINTLARGQSGIQPGSLDALIALLNRGVVPYVPSVGSLGAADLAPLSHMGLVLALEGYAAVDGPFVPAARALERAGVAPPRLAYRDAFALINGIAYTVGVGALALADIDRLIAAAEVATAMTILAANGSDTSFEARLAEGKGHPGSIASAERLRALLAGRDDDDGERAMREPLSTRTAHHVAGAARDAGAYARSVLECELNADVDNPMIAADGWRTNNAANFHSQQLADALDLMRSAVVSQAVASERRVSRLLDPARSGGLPAFLVPPEADPGVSSGLMIAQYTAAALVAELRLDAGPAAIHSIAVCAGSEDIAPMGALSARRLRAAIARVETVVAIELCCAARALDLRGRAPTEGLAPSYEALRAVVPGTSEDRLLADDIAAAVDVLRSGVVV